MKEKVIKGQIEGYWEQGYEGRIEYVFIPEEKSKIREPMIFLEKGHHLIVYDKEGKVLWSGIIELVGKSWWESFKESKLSVWSESKQKGVSYEKWIEWFWQKAPLKAEIIIKE